jgi:hypothetical protein
MPRRAARLVCVFASLAVVVPGLAQEGHPLTGTWSGDWGSAAGQRSHITLVMNWDGKNVTATLNPGPEATTIPSVVLDVTSWTVRFEADAKDPSGKPVRVAAEGRLDDIGSYHRTLSGTWIQGAAKGDFKLTRD